MSTQNISIQVDLPSDGFAVGQAAHNNTRKKVCQQGLKKAG